MDLREYQITIRYVSKLHDDFVRKDIILEELELSGPLGVLGVGHYLVFGRHKLLE